MSVSVKIYDSSLEIVADLQNAFNVSYNKRLNELWEASFELPVEDDKTDLFDLLDFAEIYDGGKRVELFRINRKIPQRDTEKASIKYECKHVLDTLNDDYILDTTRTVDGESRDHQSILKTGTDTAIDYILGEQTTTNWEKGTIDFSKNFQHEFKHQTLLRALLDVPKPWWEDFEITFDTRSYPWTLNVEQPDTTPKGTIRYGKNMQSIEREISAEKLITKLYAYGDGSGDERVTAGPFTSNVATYGTHVGIFDEQYFDDASDLETAAKKYLYKSDTPRVEYRGEAVDLYRLSNVNHLDLGEYITIYDPDLSFDTKVRVVDLSKNDVRGDPGSLSFELSNKAKQFPSYGSLAFKDKATEDNMATGSVGGAGAGGGGALKKDTITAEELAKNSIDFEFISFKDDSGEYLLGSKIKIGSAVQFEENYSPLSKYDLDDNTIDDLKNGTKYAKMLKNWRATEDKTTIAGGKIFTDSVDLDRINFSPTTSKNIVGQINAHGATKTFNSGYIEIDSATVFGTGYDPTTKLGATAQAADTAKVQGNTIIQGGYIKTNFLEADFAKIDTLDLTDTSLVTNSVNEGGADHTSGHVSVSDINAVTSATTQGVLGSASLGTDSGSAYGVGTVGTSSVLDGILISTTKDNDGHVTDVSVTKSFTTVISSVGKDSISYLTDASLATGSDSVVGSTGYEKVSVVTVS